MAVETNGRLVESFKATPNGHMASRPLRPRRQRTVAARTFSIVARYVMIIYPSAFAGTGCVVSSERTIC